MASSDLHGRVVCSKPISGSHITETGTLLASNGRMTTG